MLRHARMLPTNYSKEGFMAKGQDSQKASKKKASKTLKEKRIAKKNKTATG